MSWTGSLSGAVCYIMVLWLLPDLRDTDPGVMEEHWRMVNIPALRLRV